MNWKGRIYFYAVSAEAMRRIFIDNARARGRQKRGGGWYCVMLDDGVVLHDGDIDVIALQDVLEQLAELDSQQSRIVELRFLGGLTVEEVVEVLGVSKRKVEADWIHAKVWFRAVLDPKNLQS